MEHAVGTIELQRTQVGNPPVPEWLEEDYRQAIVDLALAGLRELPAAEDPETVRSILGVVALWKGERRQAQLLVHFTWKGSTRHFQPRNVHGDRPFVRRNRPSVSHHLRTVRLHRPLVSSRLQADRDRDTREIENRYHIPRSRSQRAGRLRDIPKRGRPA